MDNRFEYFAGIDWGTEKHRLCLLDGAGRKLEERWVEHSGASLAEMAAWLRQHTHDHPSALAVAIEVPRGALVETLLEHGFAVFAINPKQLDRFRDRYSPAGAKDDRRDALVLADSLRTDMHCFRAVRIDEPATIRLRELSRLEDELAQEQNRAVNRLREHFHRFFPQLLQLADADPPWLWTLFETAPSPARARKLTPAKIERILGQHRIRRITAEQVLSTLKSMPLTLAPGAADAVAEHALMRLPRLRLLHQQRSDLARRSEASLEELAAPAEGQSEHRDAAILLSLPGLGRKVAATMLSEAAEAIRERDYHALRCTAVPLPSPSRAAKRSSCACVAASICACATPSITGPAPVSSAIRPPKSPMPVTRPRTLPWPRFALHGRPVVEGAHLHAPTKHPLRCPTPPRMTKGATRHPAPRPSPHCFTLDEW